MVQPAKGQPGKQPRSKTTGLRVRGEKKNAYGSSHHSPTKLLMKLATGAETESQ